jgi:hypothetical protein
MVPVSGNGNNDSNVSKALAYSLSSLDFRSFQTSVMLWLGARGFEKIESLGRRHQRSRRSNGGADFIVMSGGPFGVQTAVQIRHRRTPIPKAAVSELRGYMVINGIPSGLVVSASKFSPKAYEAATSYPGRPVELVDLHDLAVSMAGLGLGVCYVDGTLVIDQAFFRSLSQLGLASAHRTRRPQRLKSRRLFRRNRYRCLWLRLFGRRRWR